MFVFCYFEKRILLGFLGVVDRNGIWQTIIGLMFVSGISIYFLLKEQLHGDKGKLILIFANYLEGKGYYMMYMMWHIVSIVCGIRRLCIKCCLK